MPAAGTGQGEMRVLAVDADDSARLNIATAVRDLGHECVVASDGDEAWRIFTRAGADVVITDCAIPGLDGPALCRAVRGAAGGDRVYLIVASTTAAADRAVAAGADDH